ncbi:LysR family transcriptional regulator [Maritalea mediterranea]|uniref:LysR family transcriptional regulator n=1 Tax=Maritalea mediterranea TaxID=2909667 RepID=A0ABS9E9N3_9HYPH|nr:LysR family transcriptional regulator [Maritalea mediterranea]MCF4099576.1 LysR family transcriptional regulator [Maritalea mediterranea]
MYENNSLIADWDVLRLILAIDRYGGVAGAARHLGVTHATVSRRLARAEDMAQIAFFERLPAGLKLTTAGQIILDHAKRVEPEFHALERHLVVHEEGMSGPLRLTIPPAILDAALSESLAQFGAQHPNILLEFVGDNQLLNLHQREADVAIRVTHEPPETLWGRKLTDQVAGFYASAAWLAQSPFAEGDLRADVPLISFHSWPEPVPQILQRKCPQVRVAARAEDMIVALQLVRSGVGITRMPRALGEAQPGLEHVRVLGWQNYMPIWVLTHPELRKAKRVAAIMRHLGAYFTQEKHRYVAEVP